jgi:hypothetical protein
MDKSEILDILCSRKVIVIAGEYGRGKTLSASALTFLISNMNESYKILSNIPLFFGKFQILYDIESMNDTKTFDGIHKKTIIFHDELQRDFNTREFQSSSAKIAGKFAVDFRKDDSLLIGTIQFMDRIDSSMNEIIQIIIIPTLINHYSNNEKIDLLERLKRKDFFTNWKIIDKKYDEFYELQINLYPFLNFYDTNFKPFPLVINHEEFLEKAEKNLSIMKLETLQNNIERKVIANRENWNNGQIELEKRNVYIQEK